MLYAACVAIGSLISSAFSRVMRRSSRLQVSSSRGTRMPLTSPAPAPSFRAIHSSAPANSRQPFSSFTTRFRRPCSSPTQRPES